VERAVHKGVAVLPFRIEDVIPSKSLEFFLSAQHWMDAFPPPRESHYRKLAGYLSAQLAAKPAAAAAAAESKSESEGGEVSAAGGLFAGPGELAHIETQLALRIGPMARFLVKREARRSAGIDELIDRLSTELEAESDRATFAQRHPSGAG
jgi:hypothetical protein